MAYVTPIYMGDIGVELEDDTPTSLVTDIQVFELSVNSSFALTPIDYNNGGTWTRYFLDAKYTSPYSFHPGTITLSFFSKLDTKQPIFYINKSADDHLVYITIKPTVATPYTADSLTSKRYYKCRCVNASMEQIDIGGYKIMVGKATWKYQYIKFAELT
jgi:hypothetical protein